MKMLRLLLVSAGLAICGVASTNAQNFTPVPSASAPGAGSPSSLQQVQIGGDAGGTGTQTGQGGQPGLSGPNAEALQAAQEFVSLVSRSALSEIAANITAQTWPSIESGLHMRNPKIDGATLAALQKELQRQTIEALSEAIQNSPAIYARNFTAQEMREIVAFYRTSAGAKMLEATPAVTAEFSAMLMQDAPRLEQHIRQGFNNILRMHGYAQ